MPLKRKFIIGDEWLYLKVYGGFRFLDKLLSDEIYPVVVALYKQKLITNFFFIRYNDAQGSHLRLRFFIERTNFSRVIDVINMQFSKYVENRLITDLSLDTYSREIERYGVNNIENAERIFGYNSMTILGELNKNPTDRWAWGSKIINQLLSCFGLTFLEKHQVFESYFKSYEKEFSINKYTKEQLSAKYRNLSKDLIEVLKSSESQTDFNDTYNQVIVQTQKNLISDQHAWSSFLRSIIHMHYNRVFISKPRENELVMYYVLSKAYKTLAITQQ